VFYLVWTPTGYQQWKSQEYFNSRFPTVTLVIDGKECVVDFREFPAFWETCPEIRVARDLQGRNRLRAFIENHNLLPPKESIRTKGRRDLVYLNVIEPFRKFRLAKERKSVDLDSPRS
jgi:hypothetical protein